MVEQPGSGRPEDRPAPSPASGSSENLPAGPWLVRNGPLLVLLLAGLAFLGHRFGVEGLLNIGKVAVGLGVVVFVHELGHFLVAKWCDVHVETFSIGFGPAIPGCSFRWGETTYKIGLCPLGGYVKMVGESPDGDDGEDDPRSFKNKPVWQRMAIISAGVTMNLVLAFACFAFVFRTHGDEQIPGVINTVAAGSPAWKAGIRTGDVIHRIGNKGNNPSFRALSSAVTHSRAGEPLALSYSARTAPESEWIHTEIQPRRYEDDQRPTIGVLSSPKLKFPARADVRPGYSSPACFQSAAAAARPPLQFEDTIIGTSDPEHPERVKDLPPDPLNPKNPDYFEFSRRLDRLADRDVVLRVRHKDGSDGEVTVPPAYHYTFGMRMRMGRITAIRDQSPAARAGVQEEDIIDQAEVTDASGQILRFVGTAPKEGAGKGVSVQPLDPVRLPYELGRWLNASAGPKTVTLSLLRTNPSRPAAGGSHQERQLVKAVVKWDDTWRDDKEAPVYTYSPLSIPELGLAYQVETTVEAVAPDSPAASAVVEKEAQIRFRKDDVIVRQGKRLTAAEGEPINLEKGDRINLQNGDVIRACQFYARGEKGEVAPAGGMVEVKPDQWAHVFAWRLQDPEVEIKKMNLRLDRGRLEVSLEAQPDTSWPLLFKDRGMVLAADTRLRKADSLGQALVMGLQNTYDFLDETVLSLRSLLTNRVSPRQLIGPVRIAIIAYSIAGRNFYEFLLFLGMIGVNLAVVNFLPIPLLDGGHMVFLAYEKLRGRPAPESLRIAAGYIGLALILGLMVTVIYFDVVAEFFPPNR